MDSDRKYQLPTYSKNAYVGRVFPKTSDSETLAKGKKPHKNKNHPQMWVLDAIFSIKGKLQV